MDWKLDKPSAAGIGEWDDWHSEAKANHPIRYFLQETLPDTFHTVWMHTARPFTRAYWALMYRFHPKHQYNVIKPRTLEPNYHEVQTRILHSVMECLVYDYEGESNRYVWYWNEDHLHAYNEMIEIYNWWLKEYPNRDDNFVNGQPLPNYPELPEEWGFMAPINEKYRDEPIVKKWSAINSIHSDAETAWYNKTEEMLIRVMKIRHFM
jgi:hypothetical protein